MKAKAHWFPALKVSVGDLSPQLSSSSKSKDGHRSLHQTHDGKESTAQVPAREKSMFLNCGTEPQLLLIFHVFQALCRIGSMLNCCQENRKVRLKICGFPLLPVKLLGQLIWYLETENKAQKKVGV